MKKIFSSVAVSAIIIALIFSAVTVLPRIWSECMDPRAGLEFFIPMLLFYVANVVMGLMFVLSALYLTIYSLIKKKLSLPAAKLTFWLLSFFVFYFIFSFIFMKTVDHVHSTVDNKMATVKRDLRLYIDENNVFPDSLDQAGIEDFVFLNISPLKIDYQSSEQQAALYLLNESMYIDLEEKPPIVRSGPQPGSIDPGCGWY